MGELIELARHGKRARTNKLGNVPPGRSKNAELRTREYLLPDEVKSMVANLQTQSAKNRLESCCSTKSRRRKRIRTGPRRLQQQTSGRVPLGPSRQHLQQGV